jgi:hypothetical protein
MLGMRVAGKVVGGKVVVDEPLPEGANVVVHLDEVEDFALTDEMEQDLAEAMDEARRGEGASPAEYFARLPPFEAPR